MRKLMSHATTLTFVVLLAGTSLAALRPPGGGTDRADEPGRLAAESAVTSGNPQDAADQDSASGNAERGQAFGACMRDHANGATGWERRLSCNVLHPGRGMTHGSAGGKVPGGKVPGAGGPPGLLRKAAGDRP